MKSILGGVVLFLVCFVFVSVGGLQAQTTFTFDVNVSCADLELRSLTRSFFSRELRELGDVRVTHTATPDYRIKVIAFKEKRRWTMSLVVTAPFGGSSAAELDAETTASLAGYEQSIEHSLTSGDSINDLGEVIRQFVNDLNREVLKPIRKELKKK